LAEAPTYSSELIFREFALAVDVVAQVNRLQGGPRKVTSLAEVVGFRKGRVVRREIFRYRQLGTDQHGRAHGRFEATGAEPTFLGRIEAAGIRPPTNLV